MGGPSTTTRHLSSAFVERVGTFLPRRGLTVASIVRVGRLVLHAPGAMRELSGVADLWSGSPRAALATARWAHHTVGGLRTQLTSGPLPAVEVHAPSDASPDRVALELGLRAARATCLERSLTLQAWLARRGDHRDVVIGVRDPAGTFGAHAWLDGDACAKDFTELTRYPARASRP